MHLRPPHARGFTLLELLVVITIVVLISAVTLPTVLPALSHRQVGEAARILQAALVGARDAAIRANAPRGIRLLPDPAFNGLSLTTNAQDPLRALAYNRFVPIEVPGDYTTGKVQIMVTASAAPQQNPTLYVEAGPSANPTGASHPALRIDEQPFYNTVIGGTPVSIPNERTSWFWNIRVGDKIQLNNSGHYYTVVGPAVINPLNPNSPSTLGSNPEYFVNDGSPPGQTQHPVTDSNNNQYYAEYLYLVNGKDDTNPPDGYIDNGWDGFDNNNNGIPDDIYEWVQPTATGSPVEQEAWVGNEITRLLAAPINTNTSPPSVTIGPFSYAISRRPTPSPGAREITLPGGVVVDATPSPYAVQFFQGQNETIYQERSRLPVDPNTFLVDIVVNENGQVVPTTEYSTPTSSYYSHPFFHFWLSERQDVHDLTDLWGSTKLPNPGGGHYLLPLPSAYYSGLTSQPAVALSGERNLLTMFTRTGQLTSNSIENFSTTDPNAPFYAAQQGAREAK